MWYCPNCDCEVDGIDVTFEEMHDERAGGCGYRVVEKPAQQGVHWTAYVVLGLGVFVLGTIFGFWLSGI